MAGDRSRHHALPACRLVVVREKLVHSGCVVPACFSRCPQEPEHWFCRSCHSIRLVGFAAVKYRVFRIGFSLEGLFWFMAGAYCSRDLSRLGHPCKHATPLCWVFLVATLAFGIAGRAWFPKRFAFLGIAPGILAGLLSAFTFYDIIERHIRLVPGNQVLSTSSFLYLYQFVPLFIVSLLVGNLRLSFTRGATLTILLLWFMIAAVLVFSALAFKKSLPRTYSFVTGGR